MEGKKLLIGGSPCTHWSIAQTKNRETEASGIGWELFLNYRIARDKYQPDFFLYENNKSMSPAIRAQITAELGVEPVLINSALVSAQNRQRLYWAGKRNPDGTYSQVTVEQPEDRGILLRDILESGVCWKEKGYALLSTTGGTTADDMVSRHQRNGAAGPVAIKPLTEKEMDYMVRETKDRRNHFDFDYFHKSVTLCGNGGGLGAKTGIYAVPVRVGADGAGTGLYAVPAAVEYNPLHSCDVVVTDQNIRCTYKDGNGTAQGYTVTFDDVKSPYVIAGHAHKMKVIERVTGKKQMPVYEVRGGRINIKGKTYPIKLADGFYIIRKLTVTECKRLQTVPDTYAFPVSDTQAYKMLGNGWTVDVIAHIMSHFTGLTEEPVEVLSMYDGMSCGHIALDKLGAEITTYYATEIDKYAIQTTQHNYPETIQLGDAFQVREEGWTPYGR